MVSRKSQNLSRKLRSDATEVGFLVDKFKLFVVSVKHRKNSIRASSVNIRVDVSAQQVFEAEKSYQTERFYALFASVSVILEKILIFTDTMFKRR